jgi:hypothetical protein
MRHAHRWGRPVFAVVFTALLVASPVDAFAHSAANSPSSNYQTSIETVTANGARTDDPPFLVEVIEAGSRLQVTYLQGAELIIQGYEQDAYLRVGPDGVFENLQSSATYINRSRTGGNDEIPSDISVDNPPQWRKVSDGRVARWHDHTAHWMGSSPPDVVAANPARTVKIQDWAVTILQENTTFQVRGELDWVPGPSGRPKLLVAAILGLALVFATVVARRSHGPRRAMVAVVCVFLAALVAIDVFHLVGIVTAVRGSGVFGRLISVGYASLAAWIMAGAAVVLLAKRRIDGLYVVTFAAGLITLVGGLADVGSLSKSAFAFQFDHELGRWSIALSLGVGLGVTVASVLLTRPVGGSEAASSARFHPEDLDDDPVPASDV